MSLEIPNDRSQGEALEYLFAAVQRRTDSPHTGCFAVNSTGTRPGATLSFLPIPNVAKPAWRWWSRVPRSGFASQML